jgi:ABC-type transporter Mla MlaB component
MSVTPPAASGSALVLSSPTIRTITDLQAELAERLDESGTVEIDGTAVDRVDTAGLQLLAAFVRDLRYDGRGVEWIGCSEALKKAAHSLGLSAALGLGGDQN